MSAAQRWAIERVVALAPDAVSVAAGRRLAGGSSWSGTGCGDEAVWGAAKGSGQNPYYVAVDLTAPAYKCTCPSRKIPCKHVLGLLMRWSQGDLLAGGEPPPYVADWLAGRAERSGRAAEHAAKQPEARVPDPVAQAKRAQQRAERVAGGLVELDRWLGDQVRGGLVRLQGSGYRVLDGLAARLVDAQAPGIASWVRGLAPLTTGVPNWTEQLLEEFALMRLLVRAHQRLDELDRDDPALAATVRAQVGYPVSKESVFARDGVTDVWSVARVVDSARDNLQQRTVHLSGTSGRSAVVLSFAAGAQPPDESLAAGTSLEATLHFYPGAWPQRALVGHRGDERPLVAPVAVCIADAVDRVAAAVAADPWVRSVPVWVHGQPVASGDHWVVADDSGEAVPVKSGPWAWTALALSGGRSTPILMKWTPRGWSVLAGYTAADAMVPL